MIRLLLFISLLGLGCQVQVAAPGPDEAWSEFSAALRKGDGARAWGFLSPETRAELTRAARAVAEAEGKPAPEDGRALLVSNRSSLVPAPKTIDATFAGDNEARVVVVDEKGVRGSVRALREEGQWRFDLVDALKPGP